MWYQNKTKHIFLYIIVVVLEKVICDDNIIQFELRLPENSDQHYVQPYRPTYKNRHVLPEKAIYCTIVPTNETDRYIFLRKYFVSIKGNAGLYTNELECQYPRSVEFPDLGDEIPKPDLTPVEKFRVALLENTMNFGEFLNKVHKGEKPEPFKPLDTQKFADEIMNDIFNKKPDPRDTIDDSAPNGIICELISDEQDTAIERPICYPAPRPPQPSTTPAPPPKATTPSSDILEKACYVLCHTGAIYQLLPCCRR